MIVGLSHVGQFNVNGILKALSGENFEIYSTCKKWLKMFLNIHSHGWREF